MLSVYRDAGWDEIIRLKEQLEGESCFRGGRYHILPLHSMVPTHDQRKVFLRPPQGVRKIILATNIAETAVTIDDIVCIINSGQSAHCLGMYLSHMHGLFGHAACNAQ